MKPVIRVFQFIALALEKIFSWAVSLPGLIVTFFATVAGTIAEIWNFLNTENNQIAAVIDSSSATVSQYATFINNMSSSSAFQLFNYSFALDVAFSLISTLLLLALSWFGFVFVTIIVSLAVIPVFVFTFKLLRFSVRVLSAGFIDI